MCRLAKFDAVSGKRLGDFLDLVTESLTDIERDPAAADYVMSVNGGNQTVPTVVLPDGTALTNPSAVQIRKYLR